MTVSVWQINDRAPRRSVLVFALLVPLNALVLGCGSETAPQGDKGATRSYGADNPNTWIARLARPELRDDAVQALRLLRTDPKIGAAIEPLADLWEREGRSVAVLRALIDIAGAGAGGPYWERILPGLRGLLTEFDPGDDAQVESAALAADAIGQAGDRHGIPMLMQAAERPLPASAAAQRVRARALAALGQFPDDPRTVKTLIRVLRDGPGNGSLAMTAAVQGLARVGGDEAALALLVAGLRAPELFPDVRGALSTMGEPAAERLIRILQGQDLAIQEIALKEGWNVDCQSAMGPFTTCQAPSMLTDRAALLVADFHAPEAVAPLVSALGEPPLPVAFAEGTPTHSQHKAVLYALGQSRDPAAAAPLWSYIEHRDTDKSMRPVAIEMYSLVANDTGELPELARYIRDDGEEEAVRLAAGVAYGRLARTADSYGPLLFMIERYRKAAAENREAADKARAQLAEIEAAAKTGANEERDGQAARLRETISLHDGRVKGYRGFQRTFERDLARAYVGVLCGADGACYAGLLDTSTEQLLGRDQTGVTTGVTKHLPDWKEWTEREKRDFYGAAIDRALVELGKLGQRSQALADALLARVDSADAPLRMAILRALPGVAPLPCDACVTRLGEVVDAQQGDAGPDELSRETAIVRNYFTWAGRRQ